MGEAELKSTYSRDDVVLLLEGAGSRSPSEYMPSQGYLDVVRGLIDRTASTVAVLCATLGDRLLDRRGGAPVLVSITRAGTPIGILVKRWLWVRYGILVPHYSISNAGGVIDESGVRWICERYPPSAVHFLDGWTSKGTVARRLHEGVQAWGIERLDASLAVLSDPGACASVFATQDDMLLPTACLGAAMSGLLSASSVNCTDAGFHRAAFASEMLSIDLTNVFLKATSLHFERIARRRITVEPCPTPSRQARHNGLNHAIALARRHNAPDLDLVNMGICESTRAFFRRRPTLLILNPLQSGPELDPLLLLARERSVPITTDELSPFRAAVI